MVANYINQNLHFGKMDNVQVLIDFFNVCIHQILFIRDVYPEELFSRTKKYSVPVRMSRHPELNQYIFDSLANIVQWIRKGSVAKVVVNIETMDSTPLERFVFEFELSDKEPNFTNEELERRFADFLLKLAIISTNVNTTIEKKFAILVYTNEEFIDDKWQILSTSELKPFNEGSKIKPVKALDNGSIRLQLFIEEMSSKRFAS